MTTSTGRKAGLRQLVARSHGYQRGMLLAGAAITALVLLVAVFAPWIAPYGYAQLRNSHGYFGSQLHPSGQHWFGTTVGGYDVLSRVVWGARTAVEVIVAGTLVGLLVGTLLGLLAGYLGGWLDNVLVIVSDAIYAFPSLLLAIVMSIVISGGSSGLWTGILSAATTTTILFIPQYFRVVRAETLRLKHEAFVDAARVVGAPRQRILFRHILTNATRSLPLILTLNAGGAVATLAGLGFVGFGIEPNSAAEWGYDLNRAQSDVAAGIWWTAVFPGVAIALTVLGLTLLGEGLNDVRDPRLRARRRIRGTATAALTAPATSEHALLELQDLHVRFATDAGTVAAVDGLDLTITAGEIVAIVGESGSGKSVTARAALGLLPDTASAHGRILLAGQDVITAPRRALRRLRGRDAAMVFQEPATTLNPVYPVGWQIAEGIRAHEKIGRREARQRAVDLLRQVGIPDPDERVRYYPHQFSGGQQQRVVIAMALALGAPLLLADEPTTALDVTVQAGILDLLRELRDTRGTAIVLITHNMGVVADIADRVIVMQDGRLVEQADTLSLFHSPQQPYTRQLLQAVPRLGQSERPAAPGGARRSAAHAGIDAADEVVVDVQQLVVDYPGRLGRGPFRAVDDVSFRLHRGEVLGLVGESGSGKSTIARTIAGLVPASAGQLTVLGHSLVPARESRFRAARRGIGYVFQDPTASFNPKLSIGQSIAEPILIHDRPAPAEVRRRVGELLDAVHLGADYAQRYPHELSGGQRQRASLARSLALRPQLLIADEPTSALDVSVQDRVLALLRELHDELHFAVLFISHDLAVVDSLANRVGVLRAGRLVELGERTAVLTAPAEDYTRDLIAASPVPDPVAQAARRAHRAAQLAETA